MCIAKYTLPLLNYSHFVQCTCVPVYNEVHKQKQKEISRNSKCQYVKQSKFYSFTINLIMNGYLMAFHVTIMSFPIITIWSLKCLGHVNRSMMSCSVTFMSWLIITLRTHKLLVQVHIILLGHQLPHNNTLSTRTFH